MERIELARLLGARRATVSRETVVVEEEDPAAFLAAFARGAAGRGTVFVADPTWRATEREQFARLVALPTRNSKPKTQDRGALGAAGWLCLPTGGSSGRMRLARHDQDTLAAAVRGCRAHFGVERIDAVGVLPLHHVSGLMAWVRCALTGGRFLPWTWADLEAGRWPGTGRGEWFVSLVPTQLHRLLARRAAAERLRRFRAVLLGGGPAWPELLERAAAARIRLAPSYGSTETAAMVTALRPEEFLAGERGCGSALPHARVTIDPNGVVQIAGGSLFRGYYPGWRREEPWSTDDLGRFDEHGGLHVLGRRDALIITGGKKADPNEVEAALRATAEFADVAVVAVPDGEWGETVAACYPAGRREPNLDSVRRLIARHLAPHKRPKHYLRIQHWPRNAQGKINRSALTALARVSVSSSGRSDV